MGYVYDLKLNAKMPFPPQKKIQHKFVLRIYWGKNRLYLEVTN